MRILLAHNHYQNPGGEDEVFRSEKELLEGQNHEVHVVTRSNSEAGRVKALGKAAQTLWSRESFGEIEKVVVERDIDIAHFHNTHFMISPSAYAGCKRHGVPVIHTLHNYRLVCPGGLLYRDGAASEECLGKTIPVRGIAAGCYRNSIAQTFFTYATHALQRTLATRREQVDRFITLSEHARRYFVRAGIPERLLVTKPNFVHPDPGRGEGRGNFFLFVGRLVPEKGTETLLEAWRDLDVPLKIAGAGPLSSSVARLAESSPSVDYLGSLANEAVLELMKDATALIIPSEWPEPFGRVVIEAFAVGTPVIASDIGGLSEIVEEGRTGYLFDPGSALSLRAAVKKLQNSPDLNAMRRSCRREFEDRYTAERNYELLISIYEDAMKATSRQ